MVHAARALGLGVMVGCMVESGPGIAAACAVASLCDHVDLDGNLLLAEDPWQGVELVDGVQLPSERPGLGMIPRVSGGEARRPGVRGEAVFHSGGGPFRRSPPRQDDARVHPLRAAPGRRHPRLDPGGETYEGIPIVARVADSLCYGPRRRSSGSRRPAARCRPCGGSSSSPASRTASTSKWACTPSSPTIPSSSSTPGATRSSSGTSPAPEGLSVPTGENLRHGATVVHTVGSDCAIGKKTMALELHLEAKRRGLASVFVPTGQTGIAIAGWGIAVDAVVADFVAGAAERLVVDGAEMGDLLWVEGQGSLIHPYYSGGDARPLPRRDAPRPRPLPQGGRHADRGAARAPDPAALRARGARRARRAARASGYRRLRGPEHDEPRRRGRPAGGAEAERETGLVADDPVRFGAGRLVDAVLERVPAAARR